MTEYYIADSSMAKGLNVVNYPVHLSTAQLWKDVSESVKYRIGIGIIGILLRQGISWPRHSELPLDFIEYHPCPLLLYKMI